MFEGTATGMQPVHVFFTTPAGHQWNWTALIIAAAQITAIGYGIWVMHKASKERGVQIAQQALDSRRQHEQTMTAMHEQHEQTMAALHEEREQQEQQALDNRRQHEQTMTALQAIIGRMSPRPPEPSAG